MALVTVVNLHNAGHIILCFIPTGWWCYWSAT